MSTKWLRVTISCLVIFMSLAVANGGDYDEVNLSHWDLKDGLEKFDKYLKSKSVLNDGRILMEAKMVMKKSSAKSGLKIAAEMIVHLSELDRCTPKVLMYIQCANDYLERMHYGYVSDRLEDLLEAGLERVKPLCRSFMNTWHDQSERDIDPASKEKLYNFYSSQAIAEHAKSDYDVADGILLIEAVKRDASASRTLAKSRKTKQGLIEFYQAYWKDIVLKPCEKFKEAMGGVMEQGYRLGLGYRRVELFEPPSQNYLDSFYRFARCLSPHQWAAAKMAAKMTLSGDKV